MASGHGGAGSSGPRRRHRALTFCHSHQNEVNFLPKADTAAGKWERGEKGHVPPHCAHGPQVKAVRLWHSRIPGCGSSASQQRLPATHVLPNPISPQGRGGSPHLPSVCLLAQLPLPAGFWRRRFLPLPQAAPWLCRWGHVSRPPSDQACCLLGDNKRRLSAKESPVV